MSIVYIESNTTGFGLALLKASVRYDDVHFLTCDPSRYEFVPQLDAGIHVTVCDTRSVEALSQVLTHIDDIRYVASTSDGFIQVAAQLTERLGLNGNTLDTIRRCQDKFALQHILNEHGIHYPLTRRLLMPDDLRDLAFPVIVKPQQGTGSMNVRYVTEAHDMPSFADDAYICQQFVSGIELSVETFTDSRAHHLLAITRKFTTKPPYFLELAHVLPMDLDAPTHRLVSETVSRALDAVGYRFGPAHTELKIDGDQVTVIEINARLAGGMIPMLMQRAYGWSMVDLYIQSHLSGRCQFTMPTPSLHAAVAFIVPDIGRPYDGIVFPEESTDAGTFKASGVNHGRYDFSDRAGYVISSGRCGLEALRRALRQRQRSQVLYIQPTKDAVDAQTLHDIVYRPPGPSRFGQLTTHLLTIEKAHLLMLRAQGIIDNAQFTALQAAVLELETHPMLLKEHYSGRGDYFDYEHYIIARCGRQTGGMIQAARSRNDINATHLLLTIKEVISDVVERALAMVERALTRASDTMTLPLPIYSQYQTAMPGTAGHYLTAQSALLLTTIESLIDIDDTLVRSPLGACAGAGTTFRTDTLLTANLLGFAQGPLNALHAITDKNAALRSISALTLLSGDINRIATDFQLWSMQEMAFVSFPQGMYGGSSNMPQKRNPYLLEWLRLHHDHTLGRLAGALTSLTHLPSGNSYQASRTAIETVSALGDTLHDMLSVMMYAIDGVHFHKAAAIQALKRGHACATLAAERLVQNGLASFREAHAAVARALGGDSATDPVTQEAAKLIAAFDNDITSTDINEYLVGGGGPASSTTHTALISLSHRLDILKRRQRVKLARATGTRQTLNHHFKRTR